MKKKMALLLIVVISTIFFHRTAYAEWYAAVSYGGNQSQDEIDYETDRRYLTESTYEKLEDQSLDFEATEIFGFKGGKWVPLFDLSNFDLGIEIDYLGYKLNSSETRLTNNRYQRGPENCVIVLFVIKYCYHDIDLIDSQSVSYKVNQSINRYGINLLVRRRYNTSETFPYGNWQIYGGLGTAKNHIETDVYIDNLRYNKTTTETSGTLIFGSKCFFTKNVSAFLELNISQIDQSLDIPFGYGQTEEESYGGSFFLLGAAYHF